MTIKKAFDYYWRLDAYEDYTKPEVYDMVKALGYRRMARSWSKHDLTRLLQRQARGLICYDKCSNREIEAFASARHRNPHMHYGMTSQGSRMTSIEALEEQDDDPKFSKFLDLPAELRNRIYELYVSEFGEILETPSQPPLGRTCRILRQEMLPVFYAYHVIEMRLICYNCDSIKFREEDPTQLFLFHLSPAHAACITKVQLTITGLRGCRFYHAYITCRIGLDTVGHSYKVMATNWLVDTQPLSDPGTQALEHQVGTVLEGLGTFAGKKVFKMRDFHALRGAAERAFA